MCNTTARDEQPLGKKGAGNAIKERIENSTIKISRAPQKVGKWNN